MSISYERLLYAQSLLKAKFQLFDNLIDHTILGFQSVIKDARQSAHYKLENYITEGPNPGQPVIKHIKACNKNFCSLKLTLLNKKTLL